MQNIYKTRRELSPPIERNAVAELEFQCLPGL
jgi:hypothetical protein